MRAENTIFKNIGIIGVGFMGGSIAACVKKTYGRKICILGLCKNKNRTRIILRQNIVDKILSLKKDQVKKIDLLIIATGIKETRNQIELISRLNPECLVIDIASIKKEICQKAANQQGLKYFIGTHPMAGGHHTGFENSNPQLFTDKPWIITPIKKHRKIHLESLISLIKSLGANPFIINEETHDKICAWSSHIHLIMSSIIVNTLSKRADLSKVIELASSGFADSTRLANFSPDIKKDIVMTNWNNILPTLNNIKEEITNFSSLAQTKKENRIHSYFVQSKKTRTLF